jgi:hypothetical protein
LAPTAAGKRLVTRASVGGQWFRAGTSTSEGVIARFATISDPEGNTIKLIQADEADPDPAFGPRIGELEERRVEVGGTRGGGIEDG